MGLFAPDALRAFFIGFGLTSLVLGINIVPHLV
jgi:hypothetical protein